MYSPSIRSQLACRYLASTPQFLYCLLIPTEVLMRKVLTTAAVALFAISTLSAVSAAPASAAVVKNGQSCKTLNAKTSYVVKGSKYQYSCVKNPYYLKTKLTWTVAECLTAIKEETTSRSDMATQRAAGLDAATLGTYQLLVDMSVDLRKLACARGV